MCKHALFHQAWMLELFAAVWISFFTVCLQNLIKYCHGFAGTVTLCSDSR